MCRSCRARQEVFTQRVPRESKISCSNAMLSWQRSWPSTWRTSRTSWLELRSKLALEPVLRSTLVLVRELRSKLVLEQVLRSKLARGCKPVLGLRSKLVLVLVLRSTLVLVQELRSKPVPVQVFRSKLVPVRVLRSRLVLVLGSSSGLARSNHCPCCKASSASRSLLLLLGRSKYR